MTKRHVVLSSLLVLLLFLLAAVAWAGSSTRYRLFWQVLSSGGAPAASRSGRVSLNGTLGQAATGVSTSASGDTVLQAGYWRGADEAEWSICLPVVVNGH